MTDSVSFTRMSDGTAEDYQLLSHYEEEDLAGFPDRVLGWLRSMDEHTGYRISRLGHSLQAATRAHRAGEDEETVVTVLLHDIGDVLAPANHSEVAAAMLRPYVSEQNYWIVRYHGLFQEKYYAHHCGRDPDARDRFRDHEYYEATVRFCEEFDQVSFDPDYPIESLAFFEPMVRRVLASPRHPSTLAVELCCRRSTEPGSVGQGGMNLDLAFECLVDRASGGDGKETSSVVLGEVAE